MNRYSLIDILRGFAALLVVFYHVLAHREWPGFPSGGLAELPKTGWVGVDLFFVISGFVISHTAMNGYAGGGDWRRAYFERRLRRIVPLYIATMAAYMFLVNPEVIRLAWMPVVHILSHLGFVHNLWHETHGSINSPNWSVGLEMQFYVLIAIATPWIARSQLWKVFLVWASVGLAWRWASTLEMVPGTSNPMLQFIYASQLPGTLDEFVFGISIAKLLHGGYLRFTPQRLSAWAAGALLLLGLACVTAVPEAQYWKSSASIVFWRPLACAGFACLLACLVMLPFDGGWVTRPFRYLGEISYGIYLWHIPVLLTLLEKTPWQGKTLLVGTVGCTIFLAALSWHGFEKLWIGQSRH
jgi:peptidoglycan/LPS O-acetylase OafA/YrhL